MKKIYEKPMIEIETYVLSASIAANCTSEVTLGPADDLHTTACDEFKDAFEVYSVRPRSTGGTPFYSDNSAGCDCYYTSGGKGYFTS